jgi:hypothetical protein
LTLNGGCWQVADEAGEGPGVMEKDDEMQVRVCHPCHPLTVHDDERGEDASDQSRGPFCGKSSLTVFLRVGVWFGQPPEGLAAAEVEQEEEGQAGGDLEVEDVPLVRSLCRGVDLLSLLSVVGFWGVNGLSPPRDVVARAAKRRVSDGGGWCGARLSGG